MQLGSANNSLITSQLTKRGNEPNLVRARETRVTHQPLLLTYTRAAICKYRLLGWVPLHEGIIHEITGDGPCYPAV